MEFVNVGRSGLRVSKICLGAFGFGSPSWQQWVLEEPDARPIIRRALELGVNFFDTADMYSQGESEAILGRALRDHVRREEVVVCTKPFHPTGPGVNERGLSRRHLFNAIDRSLAKLGMEYVDIYEIHRLDRSLPMEETLEALNDIVRTGKARYIAASNMTAWEFARAIYLQERHGWARFIAMQDQYNLVYREDEREMIPLCHAEGIGYTPYSPLARGFLVGKGAVIGAGDTAREKHDGFLAEFYTQGTDTAIRDRVHELAQRHGVPPARIAIAWMLTKPYLTAPVCGATKVGHIEDAVAALQIELTEAEIAYLEALYQPRKPLVFP